MNQVLRYFTLLLILALLGAPAAHAEAGGSDVRRLQAGTLAGGLDFTCALMSDHSVSCWGSDGTGQLGDGVGGGSVSTPPAPISLPGGLGATAITTGRDHTCALLDDGNVTCWGPNGDGQLGNGGGPTQTSPTAPITLPGGRSGAVVSNLALSAAQTTTGVAGGASGIARVSVTTTGPDPAGNTVVQVTTPASVTITGATPSVGTYASGAREWTLPSVGVGATVTLDVSYIAAAAASGSLTAQVTSTQHVISSRWSNPALALPSAAAAISITAPPVTSPTGGTPSTTASPSTASWSVPKRVVRARTRTRLNYSYTGSEPIELTLYRFADSANGPAFLRRAQRSPATPGRYGWATVMPGPGRYVAKIRTADGRLLDSLTFRIR